MKPKHNTHMMLPQQLWRRAQQLAVQEDTTITALVVEGLTRLLERRKQKGKRDERKPN